MEATETQLGGWSAISAISSTSLAGSDATKPFVGDRHGQGTACAEPYVSPRLRCVRSTPALNVERRLCGSAFFELKVGSVSWRSAEGAAGLLPEHRRRAVSKLHRPLTRAAPGRRV